MSADLTRAQCQVFSGLIGRETILLYSVAPFGTFRSTERVEAVTPRIREFGDVRHPTGPSKNVRKAMGRQICLTGCFGRARSCAISISRDDTTAITANYRER
jgi:hypothetical protein